MDFEIIALDHVSIVSRDIDASRRFYCHVLGMEEVPRPANFTFAGAWFRKGRAEIHLIGAEEAVQEAGDAPNIPTAQRDMTFARHFALQISDMDALVARLAAYNMKVAYGPRPRGDGPAQAYIYDPDGHFIELTHKP